MKIIIDRPFDIPSSTPQQRKLGSRATHPTQGLRYARAAWRALVEPYSPARPMAGAVALQVFLLYHTDDKGKAWKAKTTRPDGDNLLKVIKDAMTKAGYWKDDAQVFYELISRRWTDGESRVGIKVSGDLEEEMEE